MAEFVEVATFNFSYEVTILKTILENQGIPYFLQNENLVSIDPLASYAYGGIVLKVHPNDLNEVKEILNNLNTNLDIV
jgi:hypothetical protein